MGMLPVAVDFQPPIENKSPPQGPHLSTRSEECRCFIARLKLGCGFFFTPRNSALASGKVKFDHQGIKELLPPFLCARTVGDVTPRDLAKVGVGICLVVVAR